MPTVRSTSVAAEITGYQNFDRRVNIIGVIINRVSSEKTYEILKEAVEKYCKIKCFGYIPKMENISLSSRHLGLVEAYEVYDLKEKIEVLKSNKKFGFDKEVIQALNKWKFEPIVYRGKKIKVYFNKEFVFTPKK